MYQVKVLSSEEFDQLPYPSMETSLGVADPKTSTAYVRYTGIDSVDKYLINHELEHLIEGHGGEHSNHYRNGIYYKELGDMFANIAPIAASFLPGIGAIAGPATGFATQGMRSKPKMQEPSGDSQPMMGQQSPQQSPMESFQPPKPNIVSPGNSSGFQGGNSSSGAISGMSGGGSPIDRIKGFFSSRNPQGAF